MRSFSLTSRLLVIVLAIQALLAGALIVSGVLIARAELFYAFDAQLRGKAMSILALVHFEEEENTSSLTFDRTGVPASADPSDSDLFEVADMQGATLWMSSTQERIPDSVMSGATTQADFPLQGQTYRSIVLRQVPILENEDLQSTEIPKVTVAYAVSLNRINSRIRKLTLDLSLVSFLLLGLTAALGVWSIRKELRPLREVADSAEGISVHNWIFRTSPEARSIPELKPLVAALESLLSRLRDSFAQQREFTGDLAHELKTSVAIIKSTLQILLQRKRSFEDYRVGLEQLLGDCDRLEELTSRMLKLARIEQEAEQKLQQNLEPVDVAESCESAVARISPFAKSKKVELSLEAQNGLRLLANSEDLELLWVNLLDNAVRHSPEKSVVLIRIEPETNGNVFVHVRDSGSGIPPGEQPYIFRRFHRGNDPTSRSGKGSGLGLAICKALAESYGGTIRVVSDLGNGTCVTVQLPLLNGTREVSRTP